MLNTKLIKFAWPIMAIIALINGITILINNNDNLWLLLSGILSIIGGVIFFALTYFALKQREQ